jgi:hypothetical protein
MEMKESVRREPTVTSIESDCGVEEYHINTALEADTKCRTRRLSELLVGGRR